MKVISFDAKSARNEEVVEMARDILKMAEAGEIVDLCYCSSIRGGRVLTGFTSTEDQNLRIAAAARLLHRLNTMADLVSEAVD